MRRKKDPAPALWNHDRSLLPAFGSLCGVDEAGRGPLAGNVVAACVVFDLSGKFLPGVNDSKQLKPEQREALFPLIQERCVAWSLGEATPEEIDRINILQATFLAMRRALAALVLEPSLILVDGSLGIPEIRFSQKKLVGGDGLSASIAAASILAKVTRDRAMRKWHEHFPEYGFAQHKGYATEMHRTAISRHGLSPLHRRSFCRAFLEEAAVEVNFQA